MLVSGHSLGAGVVQYFMHDHPGPKFRAYTDGSPGSDHVNADAEDPRIMNIIRTDDAVTFVPDITAKTSNPISKLALVGLTTSLATLASAGGPIIAGGVNIGAAFINDIIITAQRKFRQGGEIFLNSPISDDFTDLLEHDKSSYVNDMATLFRFAEDLASPFATHGLAQALRADSIYNGVPVHLTVGRTTPGAGRDNGDSINPARDDDFALGGLGSDAFYFVKTDRISSTAAGGRIIDGGEGFDVLYLIGRASDYIVSTVGEKTIVEQKDAFHLITGAKLPVAVLYRVEKIDFVYDNAPILLGAGPTVHTAAPGATTLDVNPSFDVTEGGAGVLFINGTVRNDRIMLGPTKHEVFAGAGDDSVTMKPPTAPAPGPIAPAAPEDNVILHGEAGNDYLSSGSGDDLLLGDAGDDTLIGGTGINILRGGDGDDLYVIGSENDTADETGASGVDQIVTALASFVLSGPKLLGVFENLTGSGVVGQSLTGNALVNRMIGAAGDDTLNGGAEADFLDGGAGVDLAAASGAASVVYLDLISAPESSSTEPARSISFSTSKERSAAPAATFSMAITAPTFFAAAAPPTPSSAAAAMTRSMAATATTISWAGPPMTPRKPARAMT